VVYQVPFATESPLKRTLQSEEKHGALPLHNQKPEVKKSER